jgi:uncharacterized membrane protein
MNDGIFVENRDNINISGFTIKNSDGFGIHLYTYSNSAFVEHGNSTITDCIIKNNVLGGIMPFGKAFGFGMLIILVAALLGAIFAYLLYAVIDKGLSERMLEFTSERMLKRGVPEAQLDTILECAAKFQKPLFRE